MKKRGFTLIELLVVIVVLAIIALIATPIVSNVRRNARLGAAERSADNYIKAVNILLTSVELNDEPVRDGIYEIDKNGNLSFGNVELSGTKPIGGTIVVRNAQVVKDESLIKLEDYTVTYEDGIASAEEAENSKLATLSEVCEYLEDDRHNSRRNPNTIGAKYTCDLGSGAKNFYVLEAGTENKPATLILESTYDDNNYTWEAASTTKLDEIAGVWTELDRSQIGLPSMEQILVADGQDVNLLNSYDSDDWEMYTLYNWWLFATLDGDEPADCWTSTPFVGNSNQVWFVDADFYSPKNKTTSFRVRPVIKLAI